MKILAISSLGVNHRYVLEQLNSIRPFCGVIQPTGLPPAPPTSRFARVCKLARHPVACLTHRIHNWYQDALLRRIEQRARQELFPGSDVSPETWPGPRVCIRRDEINGAAAREWIETAQPDLIITSGCPILRPELFQFPRLGTLNLHWGISPAYRGEHTLFWPLYWGDPEGLGVTLHQIDNSIDCGPILAQGWPELSSDDDEASITIKSARLAAKLLCCVVDRIEQADGIHGLRPTERGRLYRRRARCWHHDALLRGSRLTGFSSLSPRPVREFHALPATRPTGRGEAAFSQATSACNG
ncbi:MAG: formyl transferase [Planctomycetaceae bacterium]|nr:hypothetical protein [Planctomycetaceae bacterium]